MSDRNIVGKDLHIIIFAGIEFDHRTAAHSQELIHGQFDRAEYGRELNFYGVDWSHLGARFLA